MNEIVHFKVVLLGDFSVGKTSVLNRQLYGDMGFASNTVGFDQHKLSIQADDSTVQLSVFDTAGQERFCGTIDTVVRGCRLFVFMYCIEKNKENGSLDFNHGFDRLKAIFEQVKAKENIGNGYVFVVQNKIDNIQDLKLRDTAKEEGEKWCKQNRAAFMLTSASTGEGVEELFKEIAKCAIKLKKADDVFEDGLDIKGGENNSKCQC